jgi:hypothetical protein
MDKRELILTRLGEIYSGIDGFNFFRNKQNISDARRPAILLYDGDEKVEEDDFNRKRPSQAPLRVHMKPETYILLAASAETVGQELNAARALVINAVLTDAELKTLVHDGDIRYDGCLTMLANGRSVTGEAGLSFTLPYILKPVDLVS